MNILKYGFLFLIAWFFCQCQRIELPEPLKGNPVFTLSGQIGTESFDILAGDAGYLMRSSFETDSIGRQLYIGAFRREDCNPPCGPNIRIGFLDTLVALSDPLALLQPGFFPYYKPDTISYLLEYPAQFNIQNLQSSGTTPVSVEWDFGDNSSSSLTNPLHPYSQSGPWEVKLNAIWPGHHSSFQQKHLDFNDPSLLCSNGFTVESIQGGTFAQCSLTGNPEDYENWTWRSGPNPACGVNILNAVDPDSSLQVLLRAEARGTEPFTYAWNTGETTAIIVPTAFGIYCLTMTDSNGCTASDCYLYNEAICAAFIEEQADGLLVPHSSGVPPFSYQWSGGNSQADFLPIQPGNYCVTITDALGCTSSTCHYALTLTDSLTTPNFSFGPLLQANAYEVCLETLSASGCFSLQCQTIRKTPAGSVETYGIDFDYSAQIDSITRPSLANKGTVWIEWENEDGMLYSTAFGAQNSPDHFFEIVAVEDFDENENRQKTRKISVRFDAILYNVNGVFYATISGSGVIAVAYP